MSSIETISNHGANYELDDDSIYEIIRQRFIVDGITDQHGIHYFEAEPTEDMANVGRTVEHRVFWEKFKNDADEMKKEYGPYEDQSLFFIAADADDYKPVSVMRVIRAEHPGQSLKLLDDIRSSNDKDTAKAARMVTNESLERLHGISTLSNCWELGTMATMPGYRNSEQGRLKKGTISAQTIRALYLSARAQGIEHMVAAMDVRPYEKLVKRYLGLPYVPLCNTEPFSYLGSEQTQLIYGHVPDFYPDMRRKMWTANGMLAHSALRLLVLGKGDQRIYLPPEHTPPEKRS